MSLHDWQQSQHFALCGLCGQVFKGAGTVARLDAHTAKAHPEYAATPLGKMTGSDSVAGTITVSKGNARGKTHKP